MNQLYFRETSLQLKQKLLMKLNQQEHIYYVCRKQEKEVANSPSYTYYNKLRNHNPNRGGGITVGIHKQFFSKNISNILPKVHELLECFLIQITGQRLELFILNIYSPLKQYYQKSKKAIENFILKLMLAKGKALFIICGDINYPKNLMPFMKDDVITIQQYTFKRIIEQKEVKSKTDCILVNQNLQTNQITLFQQLKSNYKNHIYQLSNTSSTQSKQYLSFELYDKLRKIIQIVLLRDTKENKLNSMLLENSTNFKKNQSKLYQSINITLQNIEQQIKSNKSEKAFKSINKILIMNQSKRDGSIMNCFIDGESLISCKKQILQNCLQQLAVFQQIQIKLPIITTQIESNIY